MLTDAVRAVSVGMPSAATVLMVSEVNGSRAEIGKRYVIERVNPGGRRRFEIKLLRGDSDQQHWLVDESNPSQDPIPLT
ncbi:hypothetical protein AB4144_63135, partial [Rhizobiaceae sp. 2RAB30]